MEMLIRYRYKLIRTQIRNRSSHWSTHLLFSEKESSSQALKSEHGRIIRGTHRPQSIIDQTPPGSLGSDRNSDFT